MKGMKGRALLAAVIGATCMAAPVILAFSDGSSRGSSGGSAGDGENCTACHAFNNAPGSVELRGIGRRYRRDAVYDLTVRVSDPDQAGAGFEISAETDTGHAGTLLITDQLRTQEAELSGPEYITHTLVGYQDSIADWAANGGAYEFHLQWQAPNTDVGPITIFVAGQAVDNADAFQGDRYYATYTTAIFVTEGDADADTDLDLVDFAVIQRCFGAGLWTEISEDCKSADFDGDGTVALADAESLLAGMTGPTATLPGEYVLADAVRGGLLYDKWWVVNEMAEPTGEHSLYPDFGQGSGSATFRCMECHGWDYKGRDGAFGSGSHFTDIIGVQNTTRTPQQLFGLLKADPTKVPNGHNMAAYGMTDRDVWDVVKMTLEGTIDTDEHIDGNGVFIGDVNAGDTSYRGLCGSCHGFDGLNMNLGDEASPEYIGGFARRNPWGLLHKVRFGHPGTSMPSLELLHWEPTRASDIGAHSATLP